MNWLRAALLGCTMVTAACFSKERGLTLRSDARLLGGTETAASVELPGSWVQTMRQPDRARWIGPDNFSAVQFTLAPVLVDASKCPEIAQRATDEATTRLDWIVVLLNEQLTFQDQYVGPRLAEKKLSSPEGRPGIIDYELLVPDQVPGPSQRLVMGRVICGNGGLVQIGCSTGYLKSDTIDICRKVISSVTVEGLTAPPPQAPQAPQAPAPSSM
jgi:hypothetical protein